MPELPETETIARDLAAAIPQAAIVDVAAPHPDVLRGGSVDAHRAALAGQRVHRVWRRAKLVVLDVGDAAMPRWHVAVQPRFTGQLLLDAPADDRYVCVRWTLADGRVLAYRDVRRLGTVALFAPDGWARHAAGLGLEPLDPSLGADEFSASLRGSSRPIKAVLMDQRRLAGVGNIYAAEALWGAGIDPSRPARTLDATAWAALFAALRDVLARAVAARGTSFRDYRDAHGGRGGFVPQLAVYGRAGHPCRRCGARLVGTDAIDGRGTVFCPWCQR